MMRRTPMKPSTAPIKRGSLLAQCIDQLPRLRKQKADALFTAWVAPAARAQDLQPWINPFVRILTDLQLRFSDGGKSLWMIDLAGYMSAADGYFPSAIGLLNYLRHLQPQIVVVNIINQLIVFNDCFLLSNQGWAL